MASKVGSFFQKLMRKKVISPDVTDTQLKKCLSTLDLMFLGIGAMVGSGIYVLVGIAAKEQAGPAIVLSFLAAGFTVILVAACITEFAAAVHRTGGLYLYIYMSMGELPAFLMGFTILICCMLGGAVNARAWSGYLDSLLNHAVSNYTETHIAQWNVGHTIAEYPDFIAGGVMLLVTIVVALGANCSAKFTTIFASINCLILVFVCIIGFIYADITNWTNPATGGFMPFGIKGVIAGAGVCFWAFSGFEIISTSVEETKNPQRTIPISTGLCLTIVTILYVCTAAAVTLVAPYTSIDTKAPLPSAFGYRGIEWAKIVMSIGPLCGLTTTLMSSLYAFTRVAYSMAEDGLLMSFFMHVNPCTKVPVFSAVLAGIFMSLISVFFHLSDLISFSVIITLAGYILTCMGVIILRYQSHSATSIPPVNPYSSNSNHNSTASHSQYAVLPTSDHAESAESPESPHDSELTVFYESRINGTPIKMTEDPESPLMDGIEESSPKKTPKVKKVRFSTKDTIFELGPLPQRMAAVGELKPECEWMSVCKYCHPGNWVCAAILFLCSAMVLVGVIVFYFKDQIVDGTWWAVLSLVALLITIIIIVLTLYAFQQTTEKIAFRVPCVPLVPITAIFILFMLIVANAEMRHWIGISILMLTGLVFYLSYGVHHSRLNDTITYHALDDAAVSLLTDQDSTKEDEL